MSGIQLPSEPDSGYRPTIGITMGDPAGIGAGSYRQGPG